MKRLSTFKIFLLLNIIFLAGCSDLVQDFKSISQPETLTVAFDSNSGDGTMESIKVLYQQTITLPECTFTAPDESLKFAGWTNTADGNQVVFTNGAEVEVTDDVILYALWMDKDLFQYKVVHLFQNTDADEYTENEELTQILDGYAGAETTAAALTITGFAPIDFEQCKITADDSAVVEIKYDRIPVVLSFELADGTMTSPALTDGNLVLKYGSKVPVPVVNKEGFNFFRWTPALPAEALADGLYTAVWEKIVYPCPVCDTVYDTEEEKDKCSVQEGCPEYVKTYTYAPGEEGGLSGTTTEEQGAEAKPSVNIDGEEMDNTKELNIVPKDTIAIIDTDGSKIWDPEGTGNVAVNVQGAFLNGRKIVLSPYIISQYPVTTKLYKTVMGKDPSDKTKTPMEPYDLNPVNSVTWYDAVIFCNKLSEIEELEPVYYIDVNGERVTDTAQWIEANYPLIRGDHKKNGYRLPTNAEWEFAARGGDPSAPDWNYAFSGTDIVSGAKLDTNYQTDANLDTVAYYKGNTGQKGPCTVGTKIPNRLGLYDMSGGICEWTYDFINSDYSIDDTPYLVDGVVKDPMGTETGTLHSVRGGSYFSSAFYCTNTYILSSAATLKKFSYGFRLCRNAE